MQRKRLLLIYPKNLSVSFAEMRFVREITGRAGLMNVSLATLAALTPAELEVRIVDESLEPIPYRERFDLVGITGFHQQLEQARSIAARFRAQGVPVVCGGPSVSISPERWRDVADVLVVGEAERLWPRFLADFVAGHPEPEYREPERPELSLTPVPDYRGFPASIRQRFFGGIVQTSRGCPHSCDFCDVIVYVGRKMRYKPIATIMAEVEQLHSFGLKAVVLADDNFSGSRPRAKEILRELRDWNQRQRQPLSFITQLSIDAARDQELLGLAAEAGLNRVCIGIESANPESLAEVHKTPNLRADMEADLRAFHRHGILILGTTIVGFDHDDRTVFDQLFRFLMRTGVVSPQVFPLQAPDGTPLKERVVKEGRYLDWQTSAGADQINVFNTATMIPRQMSVQELQQGALDLMWRLYQLPAAAERLERFFDDFDSSPLRGALRIPRSFLDLEATAIIARLLRRLAWPGRGEERGALLRILSRARRSAHPQRFTIAVATFLATLNVRQTLLALDPQVASRAAARA